MKHISIIAAIALAASAASAHAETAQMRVHVGDLDLMTTAGAKRALFRIRIAASEFCTIPSELWPAKGLVPCKRAMVARAVKQLDAPLVTALANPAEAVQVARH